MLMDRKVDFVCCDNPTATEFTIHILAVVAEHERDAISARTKAALAAAKANGKKLGNYRRIAEAKQRATTARAEAVRPVITETMVGFVGTPNPADTARRLINLKLVGISMA
jgi:DNA invertase Pin-like site-specific DNA recombinase